MYAHEISTFSNLSFGLFKFFKHIASPVQYLPASLSYVYMTILKSVSIPLAWFGVWLHSLSATAFGTTYISGMLALYCMILHSKQLACLYPIQGSKTDHLRKEPNKEHQPDSCKPKFLFYNSLKALCDGFTKKFKRGEPPHNYCDSLRDQIHLLTVTKQELEYKLERKIRENEIIKNEYAKNWKEIKSSAQKVRELATESKKSLRCRVDMENKLLDDYKHKVKHPFYDSLASGRRKNDESAIGSTDTHRSRRIHSRKRHEQDTERTSLAGYDEPTAEYYSLDPQEATSDEEYEPAVVEKKISLQNRVPEYTIGKKSPVKISISHYSDTIEDATGILEDPTQEKRRLSICAPTELEEVTTNGKWDPEVSLSDVKNHIKDSETFLQEEQNIERSNSCHNNEQGSVVDKIPEISLSGVENYEGSTIYLQKDLNDQPLVRTRSSGTRITGDRAEIDQLEAEKYRRRLSQSEYLEVEEERFPQNQIENEMISLAFDKIERKNSADKMRRLVEIDTHNLLDNGSEKRRKYSSTTESVAGGILKSYLRDQAGIKFKKTNPNTVTFHSVASTLESLQNEQRRTMDRLAKTLVASNTEEILSGSSGTSRMTFNDPVSFKVQNCLNKKPVKASYPLKTNSFVDQLNTSSIAKKICATDAVKQKKADEDISKLTEEITRKHRNLVEKILKTSKVLQEIKRPQQAVRTSRIKCSKALHKQLADDRSRTKSSHLVKS